MEEERSSDIEEENSFYLKPGAREVIEELRRRLAREATGPPPDGRVRALCANEGDAWPRLSFQPGTVITIHRLSEVNLGWMFGTMDGRKGWVFAGNVEIPD